MSRLRCVTEGSAAGGTLAGSQTSSRLGTNGRGGVPGSQWPGRRLQVGPASQTTPPTPRLLERVSLGTRLVKEPFLSSSFPCVLRVPPTCKVPWSVEVPGSERAAWQGG